MWKYIFGSVLFYLLLAGSCPAEELVDRIVAVVNDDVITLSEFNKEGSKFFQRINERLAPEEREAAMQQARQQILGSLIDKKITEQQAAQMGVVIREEEVDLAINNIMAQNNASIEKFRQDLAAMGMSEKEYRASIKDQIMISRLVSLAVRAKIVITEDKIKEHYEKNYLNNTDKAGYRILQMGFSWNKPQAEDSTLSPKDVAYKLAVDVRGKVLAGQSFRELARRYSYLPSATDGGDIGIFAENEMAPSMKKIILDLQPGGVSPIIETPSDFQFFKLLSVEHGGAAPFETVQEEIRDQLYQQEMEKMHDKWVKELREKAYIVKLL